MGTTQSTHTNATEISFASSAPCSLELDGAGNKQNNDNSVSGRKSNETNDTMISNNKNRSIAIADDIAIENTEVLEHEEDSVAAEFDSIDSLCDTEEYEQDLFGDDDDDEEEEEAWNKERLAILEDARNLSQMADFYQNPHKVVVTLDGAAMGRNYFTRALAPEHQDEDMMDEREDILEDMARLKTLAVDYLHPERSVVTTDPTACGRNYFDRPFAPETVSCEEAEERAQILADAAALKKLAVDYMHPERPVVTSDPTACGRNYFTRASATLQEEEDMMDEREDILKEMAQLKKLAQDYLHPELPVQTTDGCAMGRNYFTRPSAIEQVALEDAEEGVRSLQEMALMKQIAEDYLCPEKPVVSSGIGARCYFDRASEASHLEHIQSRQGVNNDDNAYDYHDHVLEMVHNGEDSYHEHSEHFDMEMDALETFKDTFRGTAIFTPTPSKEKGGVMKGVVATEDDGGNLSRSPSSVMLFELAGC